MASFVKIPHLALHIHSPRFQPFPRLTSLMCSLFLSLNILQNPRKDKCLANIIELFWKVNINIPLLDAIKQVPAYAKFLKELCTNKRKYDAHEKVMVSETASVVL